ncbi:magnesium transporter CorA family protein [Cutibacterium sp. WCA-380-WT-3A]|uniref:Magnesium transporter CorA family protein n=1 Tax=Cutibacterium porci TaxID=2605781 RepID=A0A7K0J7N7_9ACTN|nr:magnesium transporter CorA family protein [Cutibacterium porci]MSS45975.1 magnesium transporter CorA family protein [Cutibacterium porci]
MSLPRLSSRVWKDGSVVAESVSLETLSDELSNDQTLCWYDLAAPNHEDIDILADELHLDFHTVEDAEAPGERPKVTRYPDHLFLTTYAAVIGETDDPNSRLVVSRLSVWVFAHGVVSVHRDDVPEIADVLKRLDANPDLVSNGPMGIVHAILDVLVDGHFDTVQHIDDVVEDVEDQLFDDSIDTQQVQFRVYRLRKELVQFRRIVLPMREIVSTISRPSREVVAVPRVLEPYFNDLYDHSMRVSEWSDSLRDLVATIFETNLSIQDAKLNIVMKKLAGWAAIIAVPTLITGWFGQNVPFLGDGRPLGLWISIALIVVSSVVLYLIFRKEDWI